MNSHLALVSFLAGEVADDGVDYECSGLALFDCLDLLSPKNHHETVKVTLDHPANEVGCSGNPKDKVIWDHMRQQPSK